MFLKVFLSFLFFIFIRFANLPANRETLADQLTTDTGVYSGKLQCQAKVQWLSEDPSPLPLPPW
jgi:hypothetical protein